MSLRKIAQSDQFTFLLIILLLLGLAFLVIVDSSLFLSKVGEYVSFNYDDIDMEDPQPYEIIKASAQEIMVQSVYGINDNGRKQIIDIVGFALPWLILVFQAGLLLTVITESGNRFMYIIRYKTYHRWFLRNLTRVILELLFLWTLYYAAVLVFSFLLADHAGGLGNIFYHLNIYTDHDVSFVKVVVYQYVIGCLTCFIIASSQFMLSMILRDASKAYIYLSMFMLVWAFLGMFRIYNPFMMNKHSGIDDHIGVSPFFTLGFLLVTALICILISREFLRRKGL